MAKRSVIYYFARLNLIPTFNSYDEKTKFVLEALNSNRTVEKRGHIWRFSKIGMLELDNETFYYGFLVKYKDQHLEEVVIPETGDIEDEAVKNSVVAKARFFLHMRSGLICYHPVTNISEHLFREKFADVIEEAHDRFFISAEVNNIEDRIEIQNTLKQISEVSRIEFKLKPSNPNNDDMWKKIDEDLKETHTKIYNEVRETDKNVTDGNTVLNNQSLLSKLLMSVDGYGETKITGKLDGKIKVISTESNPITAPTVNDDNPADTIFSNLYTTIRNLLDRHIH